MTGLSTARRADLGLHDAIELFLTFREARNCEPVTVSNYRRVCERFARYPFAPEMVSGITDDVLVLWLARLRRDGLGDGTVAYHQRHLWAFVNWLETRGQVERGTTRMVPRVLVQEVRRPVLSAKDVAALVKVASDRGRPRQKGEPRRQEHALRNVAILRLLWSTGLRRTELCSLELEDVDLRNREIRVRHAKGKKVRTVPFDQVSKAALAEYILEERKRTPGPLFIARGGRPLTPDALYQSVSKLARRADVPGGLHAFRRGFAVNVRRSGLEMDHLQTLLGHSTSAMSRVYSELGEEEAAIRAYRSLVG